MRLKQSTSRRTSGMATGGRLPRAHVLVALALVAALAVLAAPARAQDADDPMTADDGWSFTIAPYLWATGMDGTISFEGTPDIPVDVPFGDIWSNLDMALSLHFEGRNGNWGFGLDGMYFKIGAQADFNFPIGPGEGPAGSVALDMEESVFEGFGFYRLTVSNRSTNPGFADVLVGFRYMKASQQVTTAMIDLPLRELSWTDAMIGFRGYAPLGDKFGFMARTDFAGGGSNFTWNVKGDLHWRMSNRWRLIAGYRYMDVDYEEGAGPVGREVYQMKHSGPEFAVSFSW